MMGAAAMRRNWFAPEVVQTSAMDCGPAALKCILEGFGISASYGRLREACQTGLDGTSIDTLEEVANRLGVVAEQVMLPPDQLFGAKGITLPALIVAKLPAGPTHFIVVWRQAGSWLQVMDPATGRRWVRTDAFLDDVFRHELSVPSADWRQWADSGEFEAPLLSGMAALGIGKSDSLRFIAAARSDRNWFSAAVLDAAVRLVAELERSGAVKSGAPASSLLRTLFEATCASPDDIYTLIPRDYWSVHPDPQSAALRQRRVLLRGAVLLRILGRKSGVTSGGDEDGLMPELAAALKERPDRPLATLWGFLRQDGLLAPLALTAATLMAVLVSFFEALLMRGMIEIGQSLNAGMERFLACAAVLAFMAVMLCFRLPLASQSMRLGRQLETRLRMAILAKLPNLPDRYLQSRPVSDMADRAHSLQLVRLVPGLALHFLQTAGEIALTVFGLMLIDLQVGLWSAALAAAAVVAPVLSQRLVTEADMRARSHGAALNGVMLDAMQGHVPIRVHAAEPAVRSLHEALLADWSRAMRRLLRFSAIASAAQQTICYGIAAGIMLMHYAGAQGVQGSDLLLVYWLLKLPAAGQSLAALTLQYPAQRNVLTRLIEPLSAPVLQDEPPSAPAFRATARAPLKLLRRAAHVAIEGGTVIASGHTILSDVTLSIEAGEHVAVVGPSGAGKSSLMGLLLGWHRLSQGRLLVDGRPLTMARLEALRRETAWVDPGIQIWNRSLMDNLAYSSATPDLSTALSALEAAELRPVLQRLPQGLSSPLGEGGALVSGGEGQRVRFGRALMQENVRLALLDEPFRGLSRSHRTRLMEEARAHWRHATLVCITHDVAETQAFDRVIVIDGGQVAESGPPQQLLRGNTRYRRLLMAEAEAQDGLWRDGSWNRFSLEDGNVIRSR